MGGGWGGGRRVERKEKGKGVRRDDRVSVRAETSGEASDKSREVRGQGFRKTVREAGSSCCTIFEVRGKNRTSTHRT